MIQNETSRKILILGSILMFLSVAIGAFAAHGLKDMLISNGRLDTFETGVKYQFFHSLAIIFSPLLMHFLEAKKVQIIAYSFLFGILIFSGSLYILSITNISIWGAVTPIGGVAFLFAWAYSVYNLIKYKK